MGSKKPDSPFYYTVESFHINVGSGDGAIHIMTYGTTRGIIKRQVVKAIFMDGGRLEGAGDRKKKVTKGVNDENRWTVNQTIDYIETNYDCQNKHDGKLRFDYFIVTHWDSDHYAGIIRALNVFMRESTDPNSVINNKICMNRAFFNEANGSPESFFVAPYFTEKDGSTTDPDKTLDDLRKGLNKKLKDTLKLNDDKSSVDIANASVEDGWSEHQLLLRTEWRFLLGRNFLRDEDPGSIPVNPDDVFNLTNLIDRFPPQFHKPYDGHDLADYEKPKKVPAMYCIAVNQRTMGQKPFGIYTTPTNKSSIVCMIVWKDGTENHRSHYLAGDADLALEKRLLDWIVPNWNTYPPTRPLCSSMKLSHHGSRSSNPLQMMMAFNPLSIFASAGSIRSHAHPRWELLAFMDIWDRIRNQTGKNQDNPYHDSLFFLTCYPVWLALDQNTFALAERNTGELLEESFISEYKELVHAYNNHNPTTPLGDLDLIAGWENQPTDQNIGRAQYICGRLCGRLAEISHIRPGNLDLKEGGIVFAQGNPDPPENPHNVIFVQISSVGERSLEGVTHIYMTALFYDGVLKYNVPLHDYLAKKPGWVAQQRPKDKDNSDDDDDDPKKSKKKIKKRARLRNVLKRIHHMTTRSKDPNKGWKPGKPEEPGKGKKGKGKKGKGTSSRIFSEEDEVWDLASLEDELLEDFSDEDDFASILRLKPSQSQSLLRFDQRHYLVPETLSTPPADASVIRLPAAHPMFDFMEEMAWRLLIIDQKPVSGKDIRISEADEVAKWFATVHGNTALPLSIRFETWPPPNAVGTSDNHITLDATTMPVLSFDFLIGENKIMMDTTSAADVVDGLDKSVLQDMTEIYAMLIFGLNPATPSFRVSLTDVAKFFGYSMDNFLLFRILGQMTLKLDIESATATEKKRNALWFSPGESWETVLRLQFFAETPTIDDLLRQHLSDFKISNAKVIGKTIATRKTERSGEVAHCESQLTFLLDFDIGAIKFEASLEFSKTEVLLRLRNNKSPKMGLQDILSWLGKKLGENTLNLNELLQSASEILDASKIVFRGLDIVLAVGEDGNLTGIDKIGISFQVQVNIGEYDEFKGRYPIVFRFDFEWSKAFGPSLEGSLWLPTPDFELGKYIKATPGWERHKVFEPLTDDPSKNAGSLNLKTLMSSETIDNIPNGIPTDITQLSIRITKTGIRFQGKIQCEEPEDDEQSKVPQLYLDEVSLAAEYNWAKEARGFRVSLGVDIYLDPPNTNSKGEVLPDLEPARLRGDVIYDSTDKSWALSAHLEDLTVAHIASFWSERSRGGAMAFLERMVINYIELDYSYNGSSGAKNFTFEGFLSVGLLNFDLKYKNGGEGDWEFVATVGAGADTGGATIKGILTDFIGEPPEELPEAVGDIEIGAPGSGGDLIKFRCFEKEEHTVFMFTLKVSKISLSFMQIRKIVAGEEGKNVKPKRIIKAAITDIPTIDVGIIGKLPQPFDQLFFLWTSDPGAELTKATDNKPRGLLKSEFEIIDSVEDQAATEKLFFKKIKPDLDYKPDDVVISSGSHIFIVMKKPGGESTVLLDYAFKKSGADEKPKALTFGNDPGANDGEAPAGDNKGSKAPLKKSIGPLSIENIGLIYKNGELGVTFDATFLMGPIGLSLLGFGVKVPFNKEYNLKNPPPISKVSFQLEGMVVSFDRPPLTVAGGFKRSEKDGIISYAGGLIIKFDPWQFQAAGVYASVPRKRNKTKAITGGNEVVSVNDNPQDLNDKFTMVFIFFKLNGPLFSVGFADISGLTGGFGVNSDITVPTIEQVVMFPFVKPSGTGDPNDSPLATINGLLNGTWFNPSEGKFWVAAGLKVSAFQMLNVDAVLVLKFNPGVQMGIYGVATCDVPSSKSSVKFAYVEMGISCTLDVEAGTFKVEAQLSPKSFVLHPSCHLTGGFALFSWFKDGENAVAGDWVMTIGGYHQAFVAPKQYPKPPRLRISWSLDDHLSVSGEAYFAITPKVCMGGGRLHAALSLGPLYAFFDAYVDFLINFKPFHFQAEGGVSVGVCFTLDLWLVTIRISVEIGATLKLRGPPMGGVVHVDFWVFGFDIGFGESPRPAPKLSIEEFFQTALKDSKSTQGAMLSLTNGPDKFTSSEDDVEEQAAVEKAFLITCESGLEPEDKKETKEGDAWWVRPDDFAFQTTLKFAANDITFIKDFRVDNNMLLSKATSQTVAVPERCKNIYARPMEVTESVKSAVTVTVYQYSKDVCALRNTDPGDMLAFMLLDRQWQVEAIEKAVPTSVWGRYDPKTDPQRSGNKSSELLSGTDVSIPLVMGLKIKPPEPEMSPDYIQQFNIVTDMKQSVYTDSTVVGFPKPQEASDSWLPRPSVKLDAKQVVSTWENSKFDPATVVTAWALKMKYKEGTTVTGARPKELLNRYRQMVPAMPLVAVGSSG
ncbi:hypothetical protein TWF481_008399 [Arthrobotrys musiformis]|uniref:DUF6603 domain-containing protein n=1 Tax=Arthrobotrys musiformis TaxID=47236 RepID=A0AAV9W937_9PEZI